jgi:hypothetical protein
MGSSNSAVTESWSITSWLSSNPNYIVVLLVAIMLPLVLLIDRIGMNPTVASGPTTKAKDSSTGLKEEAKKDK